MEDSEMDMVIPLKLNVRRKNLPNQTDTEAETSAFTAIQPHNYHGKQQSTMDISPLSSKSMVLVPTQTKERLDKFVQQWGKSKAQNEADKCLEKHINKHPTFKYTYIVKGENGRKISFPARLISYTLTEPALSYSPNPQYAVGAFQSKKEVLDSTSLEEKQIMHFIMNSNSTSLQYKEFPGRYRKWYASRKAFIGKPNEEDDNEKCSPHWESSDDELDQYLPISSQLCSTIKPLTMTDHPSKVVSKVKINKVELPFFEDDDFLDNLMAKVSSSTKIEREQEHTSDQSVILSGRRTPVSTSSMFDGSFEVSEHRDPGKSEKRQSPLDWEFDGRHSSSSFHREDRRTREGTREENGKRRRRSSSISLRDESRKRSRSSLSPREGENEQKKRSSTRSPRKEEVNEDNKSRPLKEGEIESFWKYALEEPVNAFGSRNCETSIPFLEEPFLREGGNEEEENKDLSESKRLSLDQRLELELGIKIDTETSHNVPYVTGMLASPLFIGKRSTGDSPSKRRTGFGPKAVLIDTLIFQCPKALPSQPYIPPHLQSRLCRPLTRLLSSVSEDSGKQKVKNEEEDGSVLDIKEDESDPPKKNWDQELKHLEALASNLEVADEAIWRELEEKLLLFEMANIFAPSGTESPSRNEDLADPNHEVSTKEIESNSLEDRLPLLPTEFKEPRKSILVMPRISLLLDGTEACQKKNVVFADSVRPGCGTSSEDDVLAPVRSPPPTQSTMSVISTLTDKSKTKLKRRKKQKCTDPDYDPVYDLMPPPSPPPGSPPPHLPQGSNSPPSLVDDLTSQSLLTKPHSPCPV